MNKMADLIAPIDARQEHTVEAETAMWVAKAETIFERKFAPVEVRFDLSGSSAGMFKASGRHCHIRYNPWLFAKYFAENLSATVPHEVAHYVIHRVYGMQQVKPHGDEWHTLMAAFGADATVTCSFDMAGIPQRRQQRHLYRCECMEHELSTRRHNTVLAGRGSYVCRRCNTELHRGGWG